MSSLIPLGKYILVMQNAAKERSISGLVVAGKTESLTGTVIIAGDKSWIKQGETILIPYNASDKVIVDNGEYLLINCEDVKAKMVV